MKSVFRFQIVVSLLACILLMGVELHGQETIQPQFMFGGSIAGPQDQTIDGFAPTAGDAMQIRSLPPAPQLNGGSGGFGFPVDPNTGRQANPLFSSPNVPDLGYPGTPLPLAQPQPRTFDPVQHNHQGFSPTPTGSVEPREYPLQQSISREPVVIPNEPDLGDFSTRPSPYPIEQLQNGQIQSGRQFDNASPILPHEESIVINEGFRRTSPTVRGGPLDDYGQEFDFENKKRDYPPFSEILKTGRYFGNAELLYLKPYFQNNTAITVEGPGAGFSRTFDYGYEAGNRFLVGFESKYGPGVEINYFQYDHQSRPSVFTSSGGYHGESTTWMAGPGRWSRLRTANAGDRLTAEHSLEVQNIGVSFFKDWKLPISRLGGGFGIQYVSIEQDLQSRLTDGGGTQIGSLSARHELRAFGPKLEFKYFRPVGHTKLEIIGGFSGAILFGNRDQTVVNTATSDISRIGADEFVMIFDVIGGLQYVHNYADNRSVYARLTLMSQAWLGGGTAMLPQDDLGFRGVGFAVGINR